MITRDKKEERTPLSDDKTKQQKANKSSAESGRVERSEGGENPLIKKDQRKSTAAKKEERTPLAQKANKSSIRLMGSEDADPSNGPEWC